MSEIQNGEALSGCLLTGKTGKLREINLSSGNQGKLGEIYKIQWNSGKYYYMLFFNYALFKNVCQKFF